MSNIDHNEVARFDTLMQDWWNPDGHAKPLHQINPIRMQFIQDQTSLQNKLTLDIGCGGGLVSEALCSAGANVTGIDASEQAIHIAKTHAAQAKLNIQYEHMDSQGYLQHNTTLFDIVTCLELIEHVPNPEQLLQDCHNLLKPGGLLFISTINRTLKAYGFTILAAEYLTDTIPKGTHDYEKFIKPSECRKMAHGFNLKQIKGIEYQLC